MHTTCDRVQPLRRHHLHPREAAQLVQPRVMTQPGRLQHTHHATGARGFQDRVAAVNEYGWRRYGPTLSHDTSVTRIGR